MNIELISSTSEETLISFGIFACAFFFAMWKIYSNLRAQIRFYESQDVTGRLALQNDLTQMHELIAGLRREFEDVEKSIENDLVDLELGNMSLHPKLKNFEVKQSASSESIYNLLAKIEDALLITKPQLLVIRLTSLNQSRCSPMQLKKSTTHRIRCDGN